jgi:hypothetical protein
MEAASDKQQSGVKGVMLTATRALRGMFQSFLAGWRESRRDFTGSSHRPHSPVTRRRDVGGVMNLSYWISRFERNAIHRPEPAWSAPIDLCAAAAPKVIRSLQQFQLGDGGGPAYLIAWNRGLLLDAACGMKPLIDLWFREEEEHSRLLGAALKRFGAPEIRGHWSFSLFCGMRKWLGVRFEVHALLITEIVSHVYYKMLHKHLRDPALRGMCALIIRDESGHIAFHRARLAADGRLRGGRVGLIREAIFRVSGLVAGTVLWVNHRGALRALGGSDAEFYRSIWKGMGRFLSGLRRDLAGPAGGHPRSGRGDLQQSRHGIA